MTKTIINKLINWSIVFTLLGVAGAILATVKQSAIIRKTSVAIIHINKEMIVLEALLSSAAANADDAKNYVLSGDTKYLGFLRRTEIELFEQATELRNLNSANPARLVTADSIHKFSVSLIDSSRLLVETRMLTGFSAAAALLNQGLADVQQNKLSKILQRITEENRYSLRYLNLKRQQESLQLNRLLLVSLLMILLFATTMLLIIRREIIRRRKIASELERLNERLQEEVRFKTAEQMHVFERISDGVVAFDTNLHYTYINSKAGEILRRPPEELLGRRALADYPDAIAAPVLNILKEALANGTHSYREIFFPPYGTWFAAHFYPSENGLSLFITDVTTKKEQEKEITKHRQFIEKLLSTSPNTIFIYDINEGKNIYINNKIDKNLGFAADELKMQGKDLLKHLMHPDDFADYTTNVLPRIIELSDQEIQVHEFRMMDKEGRWHWLHSRQSVFLRNDDGTPRQVIGTITDMTERIEAEQKTKEINSLLQSVFDSSLIWFSVLDCIRDTHGIITDFRYRYASRVTQIINKRKDLAGQIYSQVHKGFKKAGLFSMLKDVVETDQTGQKELFYDEEGFQNWFSVSAVKLNDGVVLAFEDITERKLATEQLQHAFNRFELIAKATNDALWEWDLQTNFCWGNEAHQTLYGLTTNDPVPSVEDWKIRIHPDDRERVSQTQETNLASSATYFTSEYRFRNVANEYRHIYDRCYIARSEDGKPLRLVGSMMDITEEKNAARKLAESEERYRGLINASSEMIQSMNQEGKLVFVNQTWLKCMEYNLADIAKIGIADIIDPSEYLHCNALFRRVMNGEAIHDFETIFISKSGRRIIALGSIIPRIMNQRVIGTQGFFRDITAQKNAEQSLLQSEAKYRMLIENSPAAIVRTTIKGKILLCNDAFARMLGYDTKSELEELNIASLYYAKSDREKMLTVLQDKKILNNTELRFKSKQGTLVYLIISLYISHDSISGEVFLEGAGIDITAQKIAEDELKKSEEKFHTILERNLAGIYQTNAEGKIITVNNAFAQMLGYSVQQMKQMHAISLYFSEVDRENFITKITGAGEIINSEISLKHKDGHPVYMIENCYFQTDPVSGEQFIEGVTIDISKHKRAEQLLAESEEIFMRLFAESADPILLLDETGFTECNQAAATILGYSSPKEVTVKQPWEVSPPQQPDGRQSDEKAAAMINQALKDGYNRFEWIHTKKDGTEFPVEVMLTPIIFKGKQFYYTIWRDIEDRKKAEEKLLIANQLLERAEELAQIGSWEFDLNTRERKWSKQMYRFFNHSPVNGPLENEEMIHYIHPDDQPLMSRILGSIGQDKLPEMMIFRTNPDLVQLRYLAPTLNAEKDETGRIVKLYGSLMDVTRQHIAEQIILNEKELSDSIINSLPSIFYLFNQQGKFLRWNNNFSIVSGYSDEELSQMTPLDFFESTEDKNLIASRIGEVFTKGVSFAEAPFYTKSGKKIPYYFTGAQVQIEGKSCLVGSGVDISERKRAEEEIRYTSLQLSKLAAHLQEVREEERKSIAREIHDELGQQLTAIKMDVAWIEKNMTKNSSQVKGKLANVIHMLDSSNKAIRKILRDLRMGVLDHQSLPDALNWQCEQLTEHTGIPVLFTEKGDFSTVSGQVASGIYRILQESLTNISRYAKAKKVTVFLEKNESLIKFEIADDGQGFQTSLLKTTKSLGILGMKERVNSLHGQFDLYSAPGKGTRIVITIPLTTEI